MWAWVRIPLLTYFFSYPPKLPSWIKKSKKTVATAGNRTPINCLEGNYANHYTTVAVAKISTDIQNASSLKCLRTKWQWWASQTTVRMAEWSKAPDSRHSLASLIGSVVRILVLVWGRGFKSHFWQKYFSYQNVYNIVYSQAVTHPSTNTTQCCLTSVIGRELVLSTWYGRRH